ncbi:adenylate/guanylate cyclase domain-containing protein [Pollutibacter soli]|uniref:adenylate/guanylate cyclase domain-containing protein n=1 Tax=Pollutibacter soli TaxID=3034157 RepID=UPI0030135886
MRRLVAIMFTDIEGYTSLMQQNENDAVLLLDKYKQIVLSATRQYDGRLIKFMGDGSLSTFTSSFQAVCCAEALQKEFRKHKNLPVRIGIHQGEVIIENRDIVGDAVNLSSRIQNAGVAGSVLISVKVNDELTNHPEISTVHLGSFLLKNIAMPVSLYAVKSDGLIVPGQIHAVHSDHDEHHQDGELDYSGNRRRHRWRLPLIITIAVSVLLTILLLFGVFGNRDKKDEPKTITILPFINNSADKEGSNYISEALTYEISNILSMNIRLKVRKMPARPAGMEFGSEVAGIFNTEPPTSVLDCSLQKEGDSIKILALLKRSDNNEILWSQMYMRRYSQQLRLQQDIAQKIASALESDFTKDELREIARNSNVPYKAYDLYIRGRHEQNKRDPQSMLNALDFFQKAVEVYPRYAQAWAAISDNFTIRLDNSIIPYDTAYKYGRPALDKALKLNARLPEVLAAKGIFFGSIEGKHKEAMAALEKATSMRKTDGFVHQYYAVELMADGKANEALEQINKAIELEPQVTKRQLYLKNSILMNAQRYNEAAANQQELLKSFGDSNLYNLQSAERYYRMGKNDSVSYFGNKIQNEIKDHLFWKAMLSSDKSVLRKRLMEDKNFSDLEVQAFYFICLEDNAKALDKIETAYNAREYRWLKFLNVDPDWAPLKNEPRFAAMLQKMDLN